ncbi:MAG: hypothetical protein QOJ03_1555 [Frankiaceae bacterium]|jgi:ketosteroid isomerase-like protein|nr:hypothetical protein [Frankiaceae bacterium]
MEQWELAAREHVRDLIAHYNLAGDRGWIDDMIALFAEDAVLAVDDVAHEGREAIRSVFTEATGPHPELIRHFTATLKIDVVSPDQATARCYFQVLTAQGLDHWGRYTDRFVRVDGEWRFAQRSVRIDGATPGGWAELRGYGVRGRTARTGNGGQAGRHDVP